MAITAWKSRFSAELQDKMCVFPTDDPYSVLQSRGSRLVFFASSGQQMIGAVTCQAPGSNCASGSLLSLGAGECFAAKDG